MVCLHHICPSSNLGFSNTFSCVITHNPDSSIGQSAELKFPRKKFETSLGCLYECLTCLATKLLPGSLNLRVDILIGKEPGCNPVVLDVGGSSPSLLSITRQLFVVKVK